MAPTKTLLLIALLAAATATTTCALDAESNNSILSKLFNSPQQQVATPQKKRGLFGRKKNKESSTKGESSKGEGEQTYSTYLTAALGIFLALGTWYLPIGNNSDDKQKIIINNKKLSMDYNSTCTESISDLETTIDSSSSDDDDDSVEQQQQKRRQLVQQNKPPSGYGNFLSFISEDSSPIVEPNEAEKKIAQVNEIKELMIDNEINKEKCNELFKLYDTKLDSLYKNLVKLKEKKIEQ